jgi:hypothetical protein
MEFSFRSAFNAAAPNTILNKQALAAQSTAFTEALVALRRRSRQTISRPAPTTSGAPSQVAAPGKWSQTSQPNSVAQISVE